MIRGVCTGGSLVRGILQLHTEIPLLFPALLGKPGTPLLPVSPALTILVSCIIPVSSPALKATESFRKAVRITQGKRSLHAELLMSLASSGCRPGVSGLTLSVHSAQYSPQLRGRAGDSSSSSREVWGV